MKRRVALLIIIAVALIVGLCIVNIYISLTLPNNARLNQSIDAKVSTRIREELGAVPKPQNGVDGVDGQNGKDGANGTTTIVEKQIVIQQPAEKPKDGVDGRNGKDGKDGQNGRTPLLSVDEETGDVLVKYEGDTLWNLLVEGCKLRKDCEES